MAVEIRKACGVSGGRPGHGKGEGASCVAEPACCVWKIYYRGLDLGVTLILCDSG